MIKIKNLYRGNRPDTPDQQIHPPNPKGEEGKKRTEVMDSMEVWGGIVD